MPGLTNFPNGISSLGIPTFGVPSLLPFTGKYFFVDETFTAGQPAGAGTASAPFNTIDQALANCVAGRNDVIFVGGTISLSAPLLWNKANTHLVGLCAPVRRGKLALLNAGATAFGPLVNVTASGCWFMNLNTSFGFAVTGATSPICWLDAAGGNIYQNCEFNGFGNATATTGTSNQTGARSFKLNAAVANTWANCVFGTDAFARGAVNYNLESAGGAPRSSLINCDFEADSAAGGAGGGFLLIGAAGIDRYLALTGCRLMNATGSGGTAFTQAMSVSGTAGGMVLLNQTTGYGFTHWETSASTRVLLDMPGPLALDGGKAIAASPT